MGTIDAFNVVECNKCGALFESTVVKDKLRRFKDDKKFMVTFHCPYCDARVIFKKDSKEEVFLKRLERLKEQAKRLGDTQEVNELQDEINEINREIEMNAVKTKDKKFSTKGKDAYDPTKPKNIAAAKNLAKAQGIAGTDEAYDPLDPENILKEKELAKARGAAAVDVKDSLFKGQKVTAIKSEQGLREGETYTVLGDEEIIKQIVGEDNAIVYKLQDSSGNIIVIGNPDGLFYEVKDAKGDVSYYKHFNIYETGMGDFRAELEPSMSKFYVGKPSFVGRSMIEIKSLIDQWQQTHSTDSKTKDVKMKDATSSQEEYAEKLFNKLWIELNKSEREEVLRHLEYDLNAPLKSKDSKTKDENGYVAFYKGKRAEVYANTKYEAQLKAAKVLGAKKSYEVTIELAEKDGEQVTHKAVDEENESLKVKIGDIRKNMDAARKMGFDTAPYQKEIDKLETKDNQQVVQVYKGVEIIYDDVKGEYWCRRAGATLALKDNDISKLKKSLDIYLEGKGYDSTDIYTKDPLTKKGQKILAAMKKVYGEEKGEQIFYASKNKGAISDVDGKVRDAVYPEDFEKYGWKLRQNGRELIATHPKYSVKYKGSPYEIVAKLQRWLIDYNLGKMNSVGDSKTKDKNADWSVRFIASGYGTLTDWLNDKNNAINDFNRFKNLNKEQIGEKLGINDDLVNRLSEVRLLDDKGNTVQSYRVQDSKTKDGSLDDEIKKMAREKADKPFNDDGTIRTPQQAQLAFEQWYKIIKSRYKGDSRYAAEYGDSKTKDQEIKIIIGEDPINPSPTEQKVEGNDIIYKEYTLKQLPETGEFEIYAPGGSIVGHAKALELAKLFVDRIVASKVGDSQCKDAMSESQVKSLCKQAGREFLADNPDGDLDQVAGDIAEGIAFSNPQVLEFLKKQFGGSVTRRQAREYLADLI